MSTFPDHALEHKCELLRPHSVRRHKIFSRIGDKLRIAWMIDGFHTGDRFPQLGIMKMDVFDELGLCIRWPGDEDCARIRDRFSNLIKVVGFRRCVSASDGICLVMDVSGRIIRVQDEAFRRRVGLK